MRDDRIKGTYICHQDDRLSVRNDRFGDGFSFVFYITYYIFVSRLFRIKLLYLGYLTPNFDFF